jgi:[ribosomal protein S18]-alanine N-acetyltransferase
VDINDLVTVRIATAKNIPDMISLSRESSTAAQWSPQQYDSLFQAPEGSNARLALIAEGNLPEAFQCETSPILGFLVASHHAPEWELENIVVAPEFRGKGVATQLMLALLDRVQNTNGESVFLEVRESNSAARSLYEKLGFEQTGRRKSYYSNPIEDAVLYSKNLIPTRTPP